MSLRLNQILGGADIRSPIFYDSNDTNYYIDAASTSLLNATRSVSVVAGSNSAMTGSPGSLAVYSASSPYISFHDGGVARTAYFQEAGGRFYFGDVTYTESEGSFRAPIFYDSNDTTYYTDPSSFSLISSLGIGGLTSSNNVQMYDSYVDASSSYLQSPPLIIRKDSSATGAIDQAPVGLFIYNLNGTNNTWTKLSMGSREAVGAGNTVSIAGLAAQKTAGTANSWATGNLHFWTKAGATQITNMVAYSAGYVQSDYSFRSPIFYDSNDTTYYIDAASTSQLNQVASYYLRNLAAVSTDHQFGLYFNNSIDTAYAIYREGGAWTNPYPDLRIAFHTGIKIGANAGYNGVRFYDDYGMANQVMSVNNSSDGLGANNVYVNNSLQAGSSLRAPIFYDSNDTTYYTDPASTSNILELKTNRTWYDSSASVWGGGINMAGNNPSIGFQSTSSTWWYMLHHASSAINFYRRSTSGSWNQDGIWDSSGNFIWQGSSVRGQVFYDQNNTAYYTDPASTSVLNRIDLPSGSAAINTTTPGTSAYQLNFTGQGTADNAQAITWGWSTSGAQAGIYVQSSGAYGTKMYIATTDSFATGSKTALTIDHTGVVTTNRNYLQATGSLRAPIFYDSDNTAYYIDAASTSNLNVLNAVSSTTLWVRSGSWAGDLTSNGFTREIGMQMTGGSEFVILSKSGQGYTLVDGSYYAYEAGGFYSSFNSSYGAIVGFSADSTTSVTFNCNVKAPIYYDSNNTSYYIDPASGSNLNNVTVAGTLTLTNIAKNSTAPIVINSGLSSSLGLRVYYDMNLYNTLVFTDSSWNNQGRIFGSSSVVTIQAATTTTSFVKYAGYSEEGGSFRAPIFYDSNNTSYYCDPDGNSVLNGLYVNAYYNLANNYKDIYVYGDVNTYYVVLIQGEYLYSYGRYSVTRGYNWTGPDTWYTSTHKGGLTLDWEYSGDTAWGGNDQNIRIIEFYETYSTMVAGFALPVNGGVIVWLRGGGVNGALYRIRTPIGANSTVTVYDGITATNHSSSTSFTAANSAVFSTRANTSNVASEINSRFPVRYAGTLYNDGNAVLDQSGTSQTKSGILSSAASLRAPIFYDTDNTGYYIDPNSTTSLRTVGSWRSDSSSWDGEFSGKIQYHANHWYFQAADSWLFRSSGGNNVVSISQTGSLTAAQYYTGGWFRNNSSGNGLYNESTGQHFYSDAGDMWNVASANGTQGIRLRTGGHNGTIRGYFYGNDSNDVGFLNNAGSWRVRVVGGDYTLFDGSSARAQLFYDSNDTAYYLDPAGTSNLNKLSAFTMSYNDMNSMHVNSPYVARYNGSALYRNGTMGYGTTDCNVMFSNWGSGFIDSWGSPANAPGGSTHYVGLQGFHYNHQNNSQAYGFQMLCAGEADNRFFWRSAWPNLRSWVEMIHSGNIGSQTVATAGSCTGNAATATRTSGQSGYPHAGTGMWAFYNWGGSDGGTSAPSASTYTTGLSVGSNPGDQAYGFQIANNMWNTGLWTRNYNSGFGSWIRLLDSSNYVGYSAFTGNVDGTQFRDANNTAYYIDPASTSNLVGLTVANTITGAVSGNAGSVTINYNNDSNSTYQMLWGSGNNVYGTAGVYLNPSTDVLYANAFYDAGNTAYYLDPNSTSNLLLVKTRNTFGERIAVTAASSTTIDTQYNVTELTMSTNVSLTLSNIQSSGTVHMWTIVTVGNGTAYSIAWPAAIKWPGGTAPTITSTNTKRDIYQFVTYDGGTNIYAIIVGQNL